MDALELPPDTRAKPLKPLIAVVRSLAERTRDNQPASVNHFDFGIENFNADAIRARLTELNLKFSGTSQESFKFNDPDGFLVQVNGPDYVGHV
jgi:hypothetical protein